MNMWLYYIQILLVRVRPYVYLNDSYILNVSYVNDTLHVAIRPNKVFW